jgi:hypothetical protein
MRDNITTIPITEVFEKNDGCPICRIRDMVEERTLEFVMGAAMMEPDVRIMTNESGFCSRHFDGMLSRRNRLSLALILESHLAETEKRLFSGTSVPFLPTPAVQKYKMAGEIHMNCFICERVEWGMERLVSTILMTFEKEKDFRTLFANQPIYCLPHYGILMEKGKKEMNKKSFEDFSKVLSSIIRKYLTELGADVSWFCKKADYRFEDSDWGNSKDSIERAIEFLTSRKP